MIYSSPIGKILLTADNDCLTGLYFYGAKYFPSSVDDIENDVTILAKKWLDIYFRGIEPDFSVPIKLDGSDFQIKVWNILSTIPYGKTMSYKEIARMISPKMSSQAVGTAVSKNKISIIVPCHRVINSNGEIGQYAAGAAKKEALLKLETQIK